MNSRNNVKEIKSWIKSALAEEQLTNISINILGNTEKGDGYSSDIVFVDVEGKTEDNETKTYNIVLKCTKRSQVLWDKIPIREVFENEVHLYSQIIPAFTTFQLEKGVENTFDSIAKYYGKFSAHNMEVIVLQNLKAIGYKLYDRKIPLTLDHIKLVVGEYGKVHGISAALRDQKPEKFHQLLAGYKPSWERLNSSGDFTKIFSTSIEQVYNVIKEDIVEDVAQKVLQLKNQVPYILNELINDRSHFTVVTQGDCWSNNFMYKYEETDGNKPLKVALLDWQLSSLVTPIKDLSYFLYASISGNDLKKFDDILKEYYASFSKCVRQLGSDPDKMYPYSKLLEDWKHFGKFGVLMALAVIKVALSEGDEVQDFAETLESGQTLDSVFSYEIKNKSALKERVLSILEHAVERGLL